MVVYFYAKDDCGYISIDSAFVTISDTLAPVADFIPVDTSITCSQALPQDQPVFTDNCGLFGEVEYEESSTQDPNLLACGHYSYTITRTWTAHDFCGNSTTVSQTISVVDTLANLMRLLWISPCSVPIISKTTRSTFLINAPLYKSIRVDHRRNLRIMRIAPIIIM